MTIVVIVKFRADAGRGDGATYRFIQDNILAAAMSVRKWSAKDNVKAVTMEVTKDV